MKIYFLFFLLLINNVYAIGISPSNFEINLNNGEIIEKEFFILNNGNKDKIFNISNYDFGFLNFTNFFINVDGNNEKEVRFLIKVPFETETGNYEGRIYVKEVKKEEGGINIDTLLGIKINLNVENNLTSLEERTYEDNLFLKEEFDENIKFSDSFEKENYDFLSYFNGKPEIILFYSLIALILMLCFCRILVKVIYKK